MKLAKMEDNPGGKRAASAAFELANENKISRQEAFSWANQCVYECKICDFDFSRKASTYFNCKVNDHISPQYLCDHFFRRFDSEFDAKQGCIALV